MNTYATELGYGHFCMQCLLKELRKHKLEQVEFVCGSNEPCSNCGAKNK